MASSVDRNRMCFRAYYFNSSNIQGNIQAFRCSDDKNWVDFSCIFFLTFVDFAVQFCFRCKFSFHEKPFESSLTVAWFFLTNHNSLLCIATNEIASFCIDNRLRQMAFFVPNGFFRFRFQSGQGRLSSKKLKLYVFYCLKQIHSMLPCVC